MRANEVTKKRLPELPEISPDEIYFTILIFSDRKNQEGYSPMTIVPVEEEGWKCAGRLEFHPDSILLEPKDGVTWHMDSLPKSGAIQVWATAHGEFKDLRIWGTGTLYVEAM